MELIIIVIYIVFFCVQGFVWGWATNKIVRNKGYHENWFWWGFFFGLLAVIVALTKRDLPPVSNESSHYFGGGESIVNDNNGTPRGWYCRSTTDGWTCSRCGSTNAGYIGTCACGYDRSGNKSV